MAMNRVDEDSHNHEDTTLLSRLELTMEEKKNMKLKKMRR
jgi:hypothetical protein